MVDHYFQPRSSEDLCALLILEWNLKATQILYSFVFPLFFLSVSFRTLAHLEKLPSYTEKLFFSCTIANLKKARLGKHELELKGKGVENPTHILNCQQTKRALQNGINLWLNDPGELTRFLIGSSIWWHLWLRLQKWTQARITNEGREVNATLVFCNVASTRANVLLLWWPQRRTTD